MKQVGYGCNGWSHGRHYDASWQPMFYCVDAEVLIAVIRDLWDNERPPCGPLTIKVRHRQ